MLYASEGLTFGHQPNALGLRTGKVYSDSAQGQYIRRHFWNRTEKVRNPSGVSSLISLPANPRMSLHGTARTRSPGAPRKDPGFRHSAPKRAREEGVRDRGKHLPQ